MIDLDENVPIKFDDSIVFVWPGTTPIGKEDMEDWFRENGFNVQYLEAIETNPDPGEPETGGRSDLFFALSAEDIKAFSFWRLQLGIRWLEDVFFNNQEHLYPERVRDYLQLDTMGSNKEEAGHAVDSG